MPWKTISLRKLASELGVDYCEIKEKHRLIDLIIKARKEQQLTQSALGKKLGVSQPRMANIESGIRTKQISFDLLFRILSVLGFEYRISTRREKMAA